MLEKNKKTDTPTETAASFPSEADSPITKFKAEVIRLINAERKKVSVAELKAMDILGAMADTRAKEASVDFKHTRPDGTRCFTIFAENSLKYKAAGENLAYGFKAPEAIVAAWMKSEGHRRNNLDPDFEYAGTGYFGSERGTIYCSILFYTPKSSK